MPNPLNRLHALGQSIWLDYLRRDMLENGTQARLIRDDDLSGQTSNPTIFQKAIAESDLYDEDIRAAGADADPAAVLESIMIEDIRTAADLFRPVYDRTSGADEVRVDRGEPRHSLGYPGVDRRGQAPLEPRSTGRTSW